MRRSDDLNEATRRIGLLVAASLQFTVATFLYLRGGVPLNRDVVVLITLCYAMAFWLTISAFVPSGRWRDWLVAAAMLYALLASFYVGVRIVTPGYTNDSLALLHVGSERLLKGQNPYHLSWEEIAPELNERFGLPRELLTSRTSGDPIEYPVAYPGLALMLTAPFLAAGMRDLRWVLFGAEVAAWLLLYARAPRVLRSVVWIPMILEVNIFLLYAQGGITEWLWVPAMLICARYLETGRNGAAAAALGTAAAIKQVPWLAAPFAAVWIWNTAGPSARQKIGATAQFAGVALSTFMIWNLPFMVWDARAWWLGVIEPIVSPMTPFGSGLSLFTQAGLLRMPREFFLVVQSAVFVAAVVTYHVFFPRLRYAMWAFIPVVFWFGFRSLHNYIVSWIPLILWGFLVSWTDRGIRAEPRTKLRPAVATAAAAVAAIIIAVVVFARLSFAGGLDLRVVNVRDELAIGAPTAVTLELTNNTPRVAEPRFWISWGPFSFLWMAEGPQRLDPGVRARYTIRPQGPAGLPPTTESPRRGANAVNRPNGFVVRVNDASSSIFTVSPPLAPPVATPPIRNPRFHFWMRGNGDPSRPIPIHWSDQSWAVGHDRSSLKRSEWDAMHALRLEVVQDGRTVPTAHGEWVTSALHQRIAFPRCGLSIVARPSFEPKFVGPWPAAALTLQVLDGEHAIWVVLGQSKAKAAAILPNGTRLVMLNAPPHHWSRHSVGLEGLYADAGWPIPQHITLKIAVTAHASVPGSYGADIREIEAIRKDDC